MLLEYPSERPSWDKVDRKPFFDLEVEEAVDHHVHHLIGVLDIHNGLE
jgi:hypothetical protein